MYNKEENVLNYSDYETLADGGMRELIVSTKGPGGDRINSPLQFDYEPLLFFKDCH